ncbi:MAG: DUF4440 domain-containing protein [Ilumatobacter sp.]
MDIDAIRTEIIELHRAFEACFAGDGAGIERVDASLADDHHFVGPDGALVPRAAIIDSLRNVAGAEIAIEIRNVVPAWERGSLVCASYEEWQRRPVGQTARRSTVVFERGTSAPGGLRWLSVHETWLDIDHG